MATREALREFQSRLAGRLQAARTSGVNVVAVCASSWAPNPSSTRVKNERAATAKTTSATSASLRPAARSASTSSCSTDAASLATLLAKS